MLKLKRPMVFFDVETTGTNPTQDRIVQLGAIKIMPDGTEKEYEWMVNPGCAIPAEATEVHGITDADVVFAPTFNEVAYEILAILKGADVGGYNALKFDVPLLNAEFKRAGMEWGLDSVQVIDPFIIFKVMEPKTLSKAYEFYCKKTFTEAHAALPDTRAAWDVLKAQMVAYPEIPQNVSDLVEFCNKMQIRGNNFDRDGRLAWVGSELSINFGKHKGRTLKNLSTEDRGYLEWVLTQDFTPDVKQAIQDSLIGKFQQRPRAIAD